MTIRSLVNYFFWGNSGSSSDEQNSTSTVSTTNANNIAVNSLVPAGGTPADTATPPTKKKQVTFAPIPNTPSPVSTAHSESPPLIRNPASVNTPSPLQKNTTLSTAPHSKRERINNAVLNMDNHLQTLPLEDQVPILNSLPQSAKLAIFEGRFEEAIEASLEELDRLDPNIITAACGKCSLVIIDSSLKQMNRDSITAIRKKNGGDVIDDALGRMREPSKKALERTANLLRTLALHHIVSTLRHHKFYTTADRVLLFARATGSDDSSQNLILSQTEPFIPNKS